MEINPLFISIFLFLIPYLYLFLILFRVKSGMKEVIEYYFNICEEDEHPYYNSKMELVYFDNTHLLRQALKLVKIFLPSEMTTQVKILETKLNENLDFCSTYNKNPEMCVKLNQQDLITQRGHCAYFFYMVELLTSCDKTKYKTLLKNWHDNPGHVFDYYINKYNLEICREHRVTR